MKYQAVTTYRTKHTKTKEIHGMSEQAKLDAAWALLMENPEASEVIVINPAGHHAKHDDDIYHRAGFYLDPSSFPSYSKALLPPEKPVPKPETKHIEGWEEWSMITLIVIAIVFSVAALVAFINGVIL